MHGRLKVRSSAEQEERKRVEREKKLFMYKSAMAECLKLKQSPQTSDEMGLKLSGDLLINQPDIQTLWNMRKEIISKCETNQWLDAEMSLTETCLRKNPKS